MEPNRIGRILGIGTRVAAKTLRDRTAQATATAPAPPASQPATVLRPAPSASAPPAASSTAAQPPAVATSASIAAGSRRFARGAGRFSAAIWRPFAHATGILTLQITGVFFALFAVVFGGHAWQLYKASRWRDHHLPLYGGFAVLFLWFAVSSFWRAGRRQKQT